MLETSARLLRLLSLFQGRKYWSGTDLADRLEVTSRTLRRDVDKLRTLGWSVSRTSQDAIRVVVRELLEELKCP